MCADGFLFFFACYILFLSSCLLRWKQLLILEILPEAASEFPVASVMFFFLVFINNTSNAAKRMGNLNSALEKADSQSSACDFEK